MEKCLNTVCFTTRNDRLEVMRRMLKIGITGTHSTGKTTLAKALAEELCLPLIPEQARIAIGKFKIDDLDKFKEDADMFSTFQIDILRRQLNEEMKHYHSGFISDRTTLCNFAYYAVNTCDSPKFFETYKKIALDNFVETYDVVFYVPIMFDLVDDGVRNKSVEYQRKIDNYIRYHLGMRKNVYEVKSKTVDGRVTEILKILDREGFLEKIKF